MSDNLKYDTMRQCTSELQLAVEHDLCALSGELLAAGLITENNHSALNNRHETEPDRAAKLVGFIRKRVDNKSGDYDKFIEVLKERECDHERILEILDMKYKELFSTPNTTDKTPPGSPRNEELHWCDSRILEQSKASGQDTNIGSPASLQRNKLWNANQLSVRFLNEIPEEWAYCKGGNNEESILTLAQKWKGKHIPQIKQVNHPTPADIRVWFIGNETSRSCVGVQAQDVKSQKKPTMWLNLSQGGDEYKKHLVVHEFGHALGLDHEHQRGDLWESIRPYINETAMKNDPYIGGAYKNFIADPNFQSGDRKKSKYDPDSVMHYPFQQSWLEEKYNTKDRVEAANISPDAKAALLGILQCSKGTYVTEPSQQDLDFLDKCYREKKEKKEPMKSKTDDGKAAQKKEPMKSKTDDGKAAHTDSEKGSAQPPPVKKGAATKPPKEEEHAPPKHADKEPAPRNIQQWGRYLLVRVLFLIRVLIIDVICYKGLPICYKGLLFIYHKGSENMYSAFMIILGCILMFLLQYIYGRFIA